MKRQIKIWMECFRLRTLPVSLSGVIIAIGLAKRVGYIGWPEKWDREELKAMGSRARALAETEYAKPVILEKFLAAIR